MTRARAEVLLSLVDSAQIVALRVSMNMASSAASWECKIEAQGGAWKPYGKQVADEIEKAYQKKLAAVVKFKWASEQSSSPSEDGAAAAAPLKRASETLSGPESSSPSEGGAKKKKNSFTHLN